MIDLGGDVCGDGISKLVFTNDSDRIREVKRHLASQGVYRHHDARRQGHISDDGRFRRIRARHGPGARSRGQGPFNQMTARRGGQRAGIAARGLTRIRLAAAGRACGNPESARGHQIHSSLSDRGQFSVNCDKSQRFFGSRVVQRYTVGADRRELNPCRELISPARLNEPERKSV
jgi:hypothetical protein